jgi:hypothetical protein
VLESRVFEDVVHEGDHGELLGRKTYPGTLSSLARGSAEVPKESHMSAAVETPTMRSRRWRIERRVSSNMTAPKLMFVGRGCRSFRDCGAWMQELQRQIVDGDLS